MLPARISSCRRLDLQLEISKRTAQFAAGIAQADTNPGRRGFDDIARRAPSRTVGFYGKRGDSSPRTAIEQQENFLSILLGQNPGDIPRGQTLTEQRQPPEVPPDFLRFCLNVAPIFNKRKRSCCGKCGDRRGACRIFSSNLAEQRRRLPKFRVDQPVHPGPRAHGALALH